VTGFLLALLVVGGVGGLILGIRAASLRRLTLERLAAEPATEEEEEADLRALAPPRRVLRRHPLVPWVVALAAALGLVLAGGVRPSLALAIAAVVGVLAWLVESWLAQRRTTRLETQLADAIDLMVGALRAGSGLLDALAAASQGARAPLRPQLEGVIDRIRLGDDPLEAFADLAARVPLDTVALFVTTLSIHWEVGGSLAHTLASVAKTVRERNDLTRRLRAQSTQARASVVGILGICVLIGLGTWFTHPERVEGFVGTALGGFLVASTVSLQALGLLWIAKISQVEV